MPVVDDIVAELLIDANKSGSENDAAARAAVLRTIQAVNRKMSNWVIASRTSALSVSGNAKTVTLPSTARRVKELGYYDSATDRISAPYQEITEREFNERWAGLTTLSPIDPTGRNYWFFLDDTSSSELKIRLVYPPSRSFTMMATYFEKLTDQNIDRLDDEDLIYSGSVSRLIGWFPSHKEYGRLFEEAINDMRAARRSIKRTIPEQTHPLIADHNRVGSYLVN